jgi:23S rRNA (adenine2030-N6)-methyltransferase
VVNAPFTLKDKLREAMEVVGPALARGTGHSWAVEHS